MAELLSGAVVFYEIIANKIHRKIDKNKFSLEEIKDKDSIKKPEN